MPETRSSKAPNERKYWLWVTRPEHYLDEDGIDREDLDPQSGVASDGWWTCHERTQKGDLALLWRTTPKRDIGYLIQTESDAYSIADNEYASEMNWEYGCDYQVLYKFEHPVTIEEIRASPYLQDWGAMRSRFQRRVFEIPPAHWQRLCQLAAGKNPGFRKFMTDVEKEPVSRKILLEEHIEEDLVANLGKLRPFGYDLNLYIDPDDGRSGRQLICKGNGGRIDLLCFDARKKRYVVIELKNVRAGQNTFAQISNYIGWVQDRIAGGTPVVGLVLSRGVDAKFESSCKVTDRVFHLDIEQLGFK